MTSQVAVTEYTNPREPPPAARAPSADSARQLCAGAAKLHSSLPRVHRARGSRIRGCVDTPWSVLGPTQQRWRPLTLRPAPVASLDTGPARRYAQRRASASRLWLGPAGRSAHLRTGAW